MRTTISIEDSLLERARKASLQRSCSLGEVIEDALRATLAAQPKSGDKRSVEPLKTYRGSGLQPGVDLAASGSLLEIMDTP